MQSWHISPDLHCITNTIYIRNKYVSSHLALHVHAAATKQPLNVA